MSASKAHFGLAETLRHYHAKVTAALDALLKNLSEAPLPETLVSQAFMWLEFGEIPTDPSVLLEKHINRCVSRYFHAGAFPDTWA